MSDTDNSSERHPIMLALSGLGHALSGLGWAAVGIIGIMFKYTISPEQPWYVRLFWGTHLFFGAIALLVAIGPVTLILALPVILILIVCLAVYGLVQDKQDNRWWLIFPLLIAGMFLALIGKASMSSIFDEED